MYSLWVGREFISGEDLGKIDRGEIEKEINERRKEGRKEGKKDRKKDSNGVETREVLRINVILRPVHVTVVALEKL
jgi:hypothetical protein